MKKFYPIFLDVAQKKAVVIGGGPVAARKAASLAGAGAFVEVISPALGPALSGMAERGEITHQARQYRPGDLKGALLAVAATDDPEVNRRAAVEAGEEGILINCARPPEAGSFIVPSTVMRGGLTLAISTGGGCPALTKRLRQELENLVGQEYGEFLEFLDTARAELKARLPGEKARAEALNALIGSGLVETFKTAPREEADRSGRELLDRLIAGLEDCV